jgi:hypothetical protein
MTSIATKIVMMTMTTMMTTTVVDGFEEFVGIAIGGGMMIAGEFVEFEESEGLG